ncbi:hypothetical protein RND81_07G176800 [Saponaria officinalis]|uniref:Carbohydrate kinase PfkB domain-containing protein n=1 Tax=Saponaria officinalis TaxID=3572 RepID=A0AAW1JT04_SAPOF
MASLSFTQQFLSFPRCNLKSPSKGTMGLMLFTDHKSHRKWVLSATSKHGDEVSVSHEHRTQEQEVTKKTRTRRTTTRGRKKAATASNDESELLVSSPISEQEGANQEEVKGDLQKPKRRTRRKVIVEPLGMEEAMPKKVSKRGRKSKKDVLEEHDEKSEAKVTQVGDVEETVYLSSEESDDADIYLELEKGDQDDVSSSYSWPPLVCCFGAAQHAFVPSGKPANRLIDHDIHESLKDVLWGPEKFVRAPGGSAGSVALALAKVGGRVAFMGKLGDDDFGKAMLYYLNVNNVQTRSVCIDDKRLTAVSLMKVAKRGNLRSTSVKPSAEDSLSKSEINIDVLKEAKMFYLNTSSLLDANMRRTTMRALKIAKKLGQVVFYDLNLPLPLWHSSEETKSFIQQVWNLADVIELTKQELEFLCGIKPSEEFDTKNNKRSKFVHYEPDVIAPLWHENLKVLFMSNGTSKIHYYTKEHDGSVLGVEDAPVTPFTQDMSASGDGIVAALMRMLTVQPHLITDKSYLEHAIKYAISCGVIDQWIVARQRGFPAKEGMEEDEDDIPDPNGIRSITEREFRTVHPVTS